MIRYGVLVLHAPEGLEVQVRAAVYLNLHRRTRSHFDFHRICATLTSTRAAESALCSCHRAGLGGTEGLRHEGEADGTVRWSVEGNGYVTARGRRRKVNACSNSLNRANASGFNSQACVPVDAIVDHLLRRGDKKCGKLAAALRLIVLVDQDHLEAGLHFSGHAGRARAPRPARPTCPC